MGPIADQARLRCQKGALHTRTAIPYGQDDTGQAEAAGSRSVAASQRWGARKRVKCGEVASKGGG